MKKIYIKVILGFIIISLICCNKEESIEPISNSELVISKSTYIGTMNKVIKNGFEIITDTNYLDTLIAKVIDSSSIIFINDPYTDKFRFNDSNMYYYVGGGSHYKYYQIKVDSLYFNESYYGGTDSTGSGFSYSFSGKLQ